MACALLPAGVAAVLPSPRRSAAASKGQRSQVACTNQLHWKQPLSASDFIWPEIFILLMATAELHRPRSLVGCCTCSGSSTGAAMSRSVDAVSFHADVSLRDPVDAVLGAQIVISGYWIGPEVEDGCGHVHAILQRIG
ncbi:unnamed protein product [Triticum aestivum]|uniref:Uncharacterized protein n=1 Tax=Triticum aestivum TaxID=4565 RepID=A0A7H4LCU9_WHEAT|nr:unnamed protein product [Triticum aestivum]